MDSNDVKAWLGRESMSMLKGFRDFIMRGNVVDLAVGIVVGAAFTGLVTSFTKDFIKPLINMFGGAQATGTFTVYGQSFDWSDFFNSVVNFVIVAAVLYFFVVMPLNKLAERRNRNKVPEPASVSEEVALLTQIRDALLAGNTPTAPAPRETPTDTLTDDVPR